MQADQIHVAVRPRSILECLDLAVMFCGRRPVAVIAAIALGSLPCILINPNQKISAGIQCDETLGKLIIEREGAICHWITLRIRRSAHQIRRLSTERQIRIDGLDLLPHQGIGTR